jgi:predicted ATPase
MKTVLLGQNATGKSNFIEALILIFKYLDLGKEVPNSLKLKYSITYTIRKFKISINNLKGKYEFEVLPYSESSKVKIKKILTGPKQSKVDFFKNKDKYLPKYVFAYYSGLSNKLNEFFWDHQEKFYREIIKEEFKDSNLEALRRLFYVKTIHSYFVLLAYFTHKEDESIEFLKEVLGIEDIESILFVLKMPEWAKNRIKDNPDDIFWTAKGLVRPFLEKLWELSVAPIYNEESIRTDFDDFDPQKRLYLFLKGKEQLQELAKTYTSNTALFKALESTYISKLIAEVRIKVKKTNVDGSITFKELSEGEQQLLTVLGLLKFTKDEDSLILLDEPDTHLNPIWKWRYLEFLDTVVQRPKSTQIILNTHDPLVIGGLKKEEVRIFKTTKDGKIKIEQPEIDPKARSVAGILTSELFGLPSVMSKEIEDKLNRKRKLQTLLNTGKLSKNEIQEYETLSKELDDIGFYDVSIDSRFSKFVEMTSKHEVFNKSILSKEEEEELEKISKEVLDEILKESKDE